MKAGRRWLQGWRGKLLVALMPLAGMVMLELALRLFTDAPKGQFATWFPGRRGLYPENATVEMTWGAIPYVMRINSLGLRGPEPSRDPDAFLIAAVGDSYTDGFFVDDEDTYPVILQEMLRKRGIKADVLNAARAGGSIDKQLAILREVVAPLRPKLVILQFCTNDIAELDGKSREDMLRHKLLPPFRWHREAARVLLTKTALGELAYTAWLRVSRGGEYTKARVMLADKASRYRIDGADDHAANARLFMERFARTDGLVLNGTMDDRTRVLIDDYLAVLTAFKRECDDLGAPLIFLYEPAYPQVHDPRADMTMRDLLQSWCQNTNVEFVDLTPAFQVAEGEPLYLAPVDFHLSPTGNRLTASCLATVVVQRIESTRSKAEE